MVVRGGKNAKTKIKYCLKASFFLTLQLKQPFAQGGPKRGNPTMATSTVTARKRRPTTLCWGKTIMNNIKNNVKHVLKNEIWNI